MTPSTGTKIGLELLCFFLYYKFGRVTKPVAWSFPNESQSRLWPQTAPTPLRTGRGVLRLPSYHMVITAMIYDTCKRSNLKLRISKQNMKYCPHGFGEVDNLLYLWLLRIPRNVSVFMIEKNICVRTIQTKKSHSIPLRTLWLWNMGHSQRWSPQLWLTRSGAASPAPCSWGLAEKTPSQCQACNLSSRKELHAQKCPTQVANLINHY